MTIEHCTRCGQPHHRCHAHNRAGLPCGRHPVPGLTVCDRHGGKAPQAQAAAKRRTEFAAARSFAEALTNADPDIDPDTALLQELARTQAMVEWLAAKVAEVADDDEGALVWGRTEQVEKRSGEFPGTDTTSAAKPNAWWAQWMVERKHLLDVSKACKAANLDERRVRLAEEHGQMIAGAISQILAAMLGGLVQALAAHSDAVDLIETTWPQLTSTEVPRVLRALDTTNGA